MRNDLLLENAKRDALRDRARIPKAAGVTPQHVLRPVYGRERLAQGKDLGGRVGRTSEVAGHGVKARGA